MPSPHHPDRRQGRRRVGDGRLAGGVRERGDRRGRAPRRAQHRHAAAPRPRVVGDPVRDVGVGTRRGRRRARGGGRAHPSPHRVRAGDGGVAAVAELGAHRVEGRGAGRRDGAGMARRRVRGADGGAGGAGRAGSTASPRLLFLGSPDELAAREHDEAITIPMACESEGAMEIYLEPMLPVPQLVVIGRSPAVHALTVQARSLGWDVAVIDDGGVADEHPHPELVRTVLGLVRSRHRAVDRDRRRHPGPLRRPRAARPRSTPTPATSAWSRPRSARRHCSSCCATRGSRTTQLARVHAPAGLDLGPVDNAEIAVAVLADLVARRAAGSCAPRRRRRRGRPSTPCAA